MQPLTADDPSAIGPHRLLARLGAGGMGKVYLARTPDGHLCALKVVKEELAHDDRFRARFAREVRTAQRVRGPFTPAVVDADPEAAAPWMATEYVPGPTLKEAVREGGPFPTDSLTVLALGLARALSTIHVAGLMHRDLKPSNVLLSPRGPQVIDFGIARAIEGTVLTRTGQTFGTPSYTSPEQVVGKEVTPRADVFSLGGTVLFAASGEPPFGAGGSVGTLNKVMNAEPNLDALPEGPLRDLVAWCMAKDPAERPDAETLARELSEAPSPSAEHGWLPAQARRRIDAEAGETERVRAAEHTTVPMGGEGAPPPMAGDPDRPASRWRRETVVVAATAAALVLLGGGALAWTALPVGSEDGSDQAATGAEAGGQDHGGGRDGRDDENGDSEEPGTGGDPGVHFGGFVYALSFSEDGEHIQAFGSATLSTWDWRAGELVDEYPVPTGGYFTPTGYVASTAHEYVQVWEGDSRNRIAVLGRDHESGMFDMPAITHDGSELAVLASDDGTESGEPILQFWDVAAGEVTSDLPLEGFPVHLEYAPDGSALMGVIAEEGYSEHVATIVWAPATGQELHRFDQADHYDARLSGDGDSLAVIAGREEVFVVDLTDGSTRDLESPEGASGAPSGIALSPDGSVAYGAASAVDDVDAYVWDTSTGELLSSNGLYLEHPIGVGPDGRHLVTSYYDDGVPTVQVFDATDFTLVTEFS